MSAPTPVRATSPEADGVTASRPAWASSRPDLRGRTVLVVGGSGGVGEGVVSELLDDGATVVATGRDPGRLAALAERTRSERLHVEPLEALSLELGAQVRALVDRYGRFDGVVIGVASWGDQGRRPGARRSPTTSGSGCWTRTSPACSGCSASSCPR